MTRYKRIFAALDGGSTQRFVAERALVLAHDNNAELLFGHVIDSVPYEAVGIDYDVLCENSANRIMEDIQDIVDKGIQDSEIPSIELKVRFGRVTDALLENLIKPYNPDLVICGERGLSDIKYAFLGSVSTFLIRRVDSDVLVIKPGEPGHHIEA